MKNDTLVDEKLHCYHCGDECQTDTIVTEEKHFCCHGCQTVFEILQENNLCTYYDLNQNAGISLKAKNFEGKYNYLDDAKLQAQVLDYQSESLNKVTFYIPAIHCSSCVWLLENFHKVQSGVLNARLDFLKKELSLDYDPQTTSLKTIVELLTTLGYEPLINLESSEKKHEVNHALRRLILQIGVVGFCAGNIMLLSFPEYFHLDLQNSVDATYQKFFLYLNFALSLPVFFFGASDYLKGAYISLKELAKRNTNVLSVDIPIALGITALFVRSSYETWVHHSAGYWDSLSGLVLFLLVGKWIQQVTYNFLSFERNYKSYFPLAVKVLKDKKEQFLNVLDLKKDDRMFIHHQELIPTDSILLDGKALVDYSFVTGESEPVTKEKGELIYAGGRQMGERIELLVQKNVSQSYLTQLWNNETFSKEKTIPTTELANKFSKYFTFITLGIALVTGIYWQINDPSLVWTTVTAVLMVACPCALTLSLPFTMGTTMTIFGRNKFFVKNQGVIQLLTEIDTIVFDKTGTLTESNKGEVHYEGEELLQVEKQWVKALVLQSTHPLSKMVATFLNDENSTRKYKLDYFFESKGAGIEGVVEGVMIKVGSDKFIDVPNNFVHKKSQVFLSINNEYKGCFSVEPLYRTGWQKTLKTLSDKFKLALLSGDNDLEKQRLAPYFVDNSIYFNQKPQDKLNYIKNEQEKGSSILMVGDGLNDAGALRQSNVGIALSEDVMAFSPSCDAILDASRFADMGRFLRFSKTALNIVTASFILSIIYNFIGIGWAVSGTLSPVYAAIFMPLSTLSVVFFSVGLTYLFAKIRGLR